MLKVLAARLQQGHRTIKFPDGPPPPLPERFRGLPIVTNVACPEGCRACAEACPTGALENPVSFRVDLGKCLFCPDCEEACPIHRISFEKEYRLAVRHREDLFIENKKPAPEPAGAMERDLRKLLGRSLKLRQVSAGGCNGCEADINVLGTVGWDLGRFGIQFVASPRHADGLLITGPVTKNMELALKKTYAAIPAPKIVIATGACALSGGPFIGREEVCNGAESVVPVDLFIPGCPPHPLTILDGLLRFIGRIE